MVKNEKPVDSQRSENTARRSIVIEQLDRTVFMVGEPRTGRAHESMPRIARVCVMEELNPPNHLDSGFPR